MDLNTIISLITPHLKEIEEFYNAFKAFTKANPVMGGMAGVWLLGVITYLLKSIPTKIWRNILRYTTVSVTLNNMNSSFHSLLSWYEKEKGVKNDRTIRITNGTHGWDETSVSIGLGYHYFIHKGFPFKLNRSIQSSDGGDRVKEEIRITTIGFNQKRLINLIKETIPKKKDFVPQLYTVEGDNWGISQELGKRSWESVILKNGQKDRILKFIEEFSNSKDWYVRMGISYKTGVLLEGPPGTGKTSIVKALACHLNKNLCMISCSSVTEGKFHKLISNTPKDSIVLMEDFDSIGATKSREIKDGGEKLSDLLGMSLSGILNAIDGVYSSNGRIIIATTNCADELDAALLRPGRFDLKETIGYADDYMVKKMFNKFYPDFHIDKVSTGNNISLAQVENCFLIEKENPDKALKLVKHLKSENNPIKVKINYSTESDSEEGGLQVRKMDEAEVCEEVG